MLARQVERVMLTVKAAPDADRLQQEVGWRLAFAKHDRSGGGVQRQGRETQSRRCQEARTHRHRNRESGRVTPANRLHEGDAQPLTLHDLPHRHEPVSVECGFGDDS